MDRELSLVEHLGELKKRIIISLVALGLASALCFPFSSSVLMILRLPASGVIGKLVFFSPQEGFLIYMRIAILCGLILSMPVILYQLWLFILPAIDEKVKKRVGLFIFFSSLSFIAGSSFAFFILMPPALRFLLSFASDQLEAVISGDKYISFVISLILGGGFVFQMPILGLFLTKLGAINPQMLRSKYKYAIVAIFVIAAMITPTPDALNMLILAGPMIFLYELSIWVSFFAATKPKARE